MEEVNVLAMTVCRSRGGEGKTTTSASERVSSLPYLLPEHVLAAPSPAAIVSLVFQDPKPDKISMAVYHLA